MQRITSVMGTLVVALALGLAGPAAAASASERERDRGPRGDRPVYLALGDSWAAGQQSAPPARTFERTAARWKANGFVAQFHDTLREDLDCRPVHGRGGHGDDDDRRRPGKHGGHDDDRGDRRDGCPRLELMNLSRTAIPGGPGGVTTETVLTAGDQLDQAVALIQRRNGDRSPRNDVEVVSVTVGGNDLFAPAVAACVLSADPATTCAPALQATFAGFASRYDQILTELRAAAGEDVVLLTTTYDNPLPFCRLGAGNPLSAPLGDWILEGGTLPPPLDALGTLEAGFNDLIRALSAEHGAIPVDTFGILAPEDWVGGEDCLHPDASGHRTIAAAFAAAVPE